MNSRTFQSRSFELSRFSASKRRLAVAGRAAVQNAIAVADGTTRRIAPHALQDFSNLDFKRGHAGQRLQVACGAAHCDVVGWRAPQVVQRNYALPDGLWYGSTPELLADHQGEGVESMIDEIEAAVASHPYANQYLSYLAPIAIHFWRT